MHRVLILGAGFGGIAAALGLRERLEPSDEVILVDRRTSFAMGLRKNWGLAGMESHSAGERSLAVLAARGVDVRRGSVEAIDPGARAAVIDGERLEAESLIVALGAESDPGSVPGLSEHALDAFDREANAANAEVIAAFGGGRVVIGVFGAPHPCPPAPYELALMLAERFDERDLRYGMLVSTPLPRSLPILGEAGCAAFDGRLAGAGISLRTGTQVTEVRAGEVLTTDGRIPFDLLLAVPPHRAPTVVREAGLTGPSGWVAVDPRTLETRFDGVFAVGDVTAIPLSTGAALPKAGVFAQAEGEVVAERIAARRAGRTPSAMFAGEGMCFLETGRGHAAMVRGSFLSEPPQVELTEPTEAGFAAKRAFESERLTAWFGG
ncbi:FAD/NAD(P)-binding oxidoreductase [soil metagenome]